MGDDIGRIVGITLNPNSAKQPQDHIGGRERDKNAQQAAVPTSGSTPVEIDPDDIDPGPPHLVDIVI